MKKQAMAVLFASLVLGLAACGSVGDGAKKADSATEQTKGEDTGDGAELSSSTDKGDSDKTKGLVSDQNASDPDAAGKDGDSKEPEEVDARTADSTVIGDVDEQAADSAGNGVTGEQAADSDPAEAPDDGSAGSGGTADSETEGGEAVTEVQGRIGQEGDDSAVGISEELPTDPKSITVTSAEDGVSLLKAIYGTSDDESGNPYTFQYLDTFTLDEGEFYGYQWSWKVDEDHFSKISDVLVKTDGSAVYQGVYNGQEWEEVYYEDNQLR